VASATAVEKIPSHGAVNRPSLVSVGVIVWLSSELMFFAALFAIYFTVRSQAPFPWPPEEGIGPTHVGPVELHVVYALIFTIILVLSSVTCQLGVFAAERGDVYRLRQWFTITFVMGLIFVAAQMNEYFEENSFSISSHSYGSVYYLTTGFHALHVTGGLVAFLIVLARTKFTPFTHETATSAIVVSYYWHFVDVVWVGLFAVIYLLK
jgi:cytochrome c oxidase subunit III